MNTKRIRLSLILLVFIVVGSFQNCAAPDVSSGVVTKNAVSSSSSLSSGAVVATYSPSVIAAGDQVVISATGGTQPYTFILSSGKGSLSSNVYTSTSVAETVTVVVKDSKGYSTYTIFAVGAPTGGTVATPIPVGATPTPVPARPTPVPTPVPVASTALQTTLPNGTIVVRSVSWNGQGACSLAFQRDRAQSSDDDERTLRAVFRYEICLVMSRDASTDEVDGYEDMFIDDHSQGLAPMLYSFQTGANARFGIDTMLPQDYVSFLFRLMLNREPSQTELYGSLAQLQAGTSKFALYTGIVQTIVIKEDPFLAWAVSRTQ